MLPFSFNDVAPNGFIGWGLETAPAPAPKPKSSPVIEQPIPIATATAAAAADVSGLVREDEPIDDTAAARHAAMERAGGAGTRPKRGVRAADAKSNAAAAAAPRLRLGIEIVSAFVSTSAGAINVTPTVQSLVDANGGRGFRLISPDFATVFLRSAKRVTATKIDRLAVRYRLLPRTVGVAPAPVAVAAAPAPAPAFRLKAPKIVRAKTVKREAGDKPRADAKYAAEADAKAGIHLIQWPAGCYCVELTVNTPTIMAGRVPDLPLDSDDDVPNDASASTVTAAAGSGTGSATDAFAGDTAATPPYDPLSGAAPLILCRVLYGADCRSAVDVTPKALEWMKRSAGGGFIIPPGHSLNEIFGDPIYGVYKHLFVTYRYGTCGQYRERIIAESHTGLKLPAVLSGFEIRQFGSTGLHTPGGVADAPTLADAPKLPLARAMAVLVNNPAGSDVTFVAHESTDVKSKPGASQQPAAAGAQKLYAHKAILAARSEHFAKLFDANSQWMEAKLSEIPINPAFSFNTFRAFVHYLYTDEIDPRVMSDPTALEALGAAADFYCVAILRLRVALRVFALTQSTKALAPPNTTHPPALYDRILKLLSLAIETLNANAPATVSAAATAGTTGAASAAVPPTASSTSSTSITSGTGGPTSVAAQLARDLKQKCESFIHSNYAAVVESDALSRVQPDVLRAVLSTLSSPLDF